MVKPSLRDNTPVSLRDEFDASCKVWSRKCFFVLVVVREGRKKRCKRRRNEGCYRFQAHSKGPCLEGKKIEFGVSWISYFMKKKSPPLGIALVYFLAFWSLACLGISCLDRCCFSLFSFKYLYSIHRKIGQIAWYKKTSPCSAIWITVIIQILF